MIFLSVILRPAVSRRTNVILGALYAITVALGAIGEGWAYYLFLSLAEVVLALLIIWYAWRWPEQRTDPAQRVD
jgi:hypothetical protein